MRGYRKRPGTQGFSVPLVGASLFFIISLFLFASYKNSAYQQAKKEIYSLYTANRAFDLDEVYQDGLTAIYAKEYGKTATEAGCEALPLCKMFDEEQLGELAESIRRYGVLQPLLVQKKGDRYELIAGERRWRAAKLAGFREVPVIVREYTRQQTMEIALIENVQRADLNPIEEAKAYQMLIQEFGLRQEDVAERVAKNRATITNSMRLLKLDERVQEMLIQDRLTGGHARALLSLEDGEKQYQLALKTVENHLSVREVERLVKELLKPKKAKKKAEPERDMEVFFKDVEEKLKGVMGTKVSINRKDKNKGRIEIEYYSSAELERLIELLESLRQ